MANDTLKLQIEIEKGEAEQALEELQDKAQIELDINTDQAEDNLDKVGDKIDELADKSEEVGDKFSKNFTRFIGGALAGIGHLIQKAGELGEIQNGTKDNPSWWDRTKKYGGAAITGGVAGFMVGGPAGAVVGAGVAAGAMLYKDVIKDEKQYDKEMENLDKTNLKNNEQKQKELARNEEKARKEKEREEARATRERRREEKRLQREEEKRIKEEKREAEKQKREQEKLERDLNKQMVKDFLQDTNNLIDDENTKQSTIRGEMGLLSESQSTVFSSLAKMGLYANSADVSNIGNAENYRMQMLDLTKQLVDSMNEQLRLNSEKQEVQSRWQ